MDRLVIRRPDDFHNHFRDGAALARTVPDCARSFARALAMPNLIPPVDNLPALEQYRERILAQRPAGSDFQPLMSLYLSADLTVATLRRARAAGVVAVKWYPRGATTNSGAGLSQYEDFKPLLAAMVEEGLLLLIHGEVTDPAVDIFDRESEFITSTLSKLRREFPALKIVLEHLTSAVGVEFILRQEKNTAATITAHHLLANRNDLLVGGIKPHYYCLPILKTERDRQALLQAATSGDPRFFLGTDSAPHGRGSKENGCGCAGCYTGAQALELYATAFAQVDKLARLEDFASRFGAEFYGLPLNAGTVSLVRRPQPIPATLAFGSDELVPFWAGRTLDWFLE